MKKAFLITLGLSLHIFQVAQASDTVIKYCGLDTACYTILSWFHRTDWLIFAYRNETWCLKKKTDLKINVQDRDLYYLRFKESVNGRTISTYRTPLHEAIYQGHLEAVQYFCLHGADKNKIIKTSENLLPEERASENDSYSVLHLAIYGIQSDKIENKINSIKQNNYIGLSAIQLAKELHHKHYHQGVKDSVSFEKRKEIYTFLTKHE